jgi:hypothetical protein
MKENRPINGERVKQKKRRNDTVYVRNLFYAHGILI